jgi:hypothetical protein
MALNVSDHRSFTFPPWKFNWNNVYFLCPFMIHAHLCIKDIYSVGIGRRRINYVLHVEINVERNEMRMSATGFLLPTCVSHAPRVPTTSHPPICSQQYLASSCREYSSEAEAGIVSLPRRSNNSRELVAEGRRSRTLNSNHRNCNDEANNSDGSQNLSMYCLLFMLAPCYWRPVVFRS